MTKPSAIASAGIGASRTSPVLSEGSVSVYWQDSTTRQYTFEDRATLADRVRDVTFDNTVYGLAAQGSRVFGQGAAVQHRVTLGGDWSMTTQEGVRDGVVPPVGETFPIRAFPKTEYQLAGLFVQDEIELLDGALSIIPAVRYDWYDLSPKVDARFPAAASGQSDDHISPKLGVVYWTGQHLGVFANYALGFRAPSPMQVNNFFENPVLRLSLDPEPEPVARDQRKLRGRLPSARHRCGGRKDAAEHHRLRHPTTTTSSTRWRWPAAASPASIRWSISTST